VSIQLQVRGICGLRPGIPGTSEQITVSSLVGRFLEHTRLYYFRNGGDEEVLAGSADLMPRNLDRRIEVLFPIEDPLLRSWLTTMILPVHLADNVKNRILTADGTYVRVARTSGQPVIHAQEWCIANRGSWKEARGDATKQG
jgi:polyphosphate kinase